MVQIRTIDELEALYYGYNRNLLRKADAPITTSTVGVFNAIYGAYAWAQLNLEANAFGILPKYPWEGIIYYDNGDDSFYEFWIN